VQVGIAVSAVIAERSFLGKLHPERGVRPPHLDRRAASHGPDP